MTLRKFAFENIGRPTAQPELVGTGNTSGSLTSTDARPQRLVTLSAGAKRQLEIADPNQVTIKVRKCVSSLLWKSYNEKFNADFSIITYEIGHEDRDKLEYAIEIVQKSMDSLPFKEIVERVKYIAPVVTLGASFDADMLHGKCIAIAEQLQQYPADIIIYSIDAVKKKVKFFPSFAEFAEVCEPMVHPRRSLLNKLHKCIALYQ
tara:strand:+ start:163 stop:777 length:615 start_codon:yes stop_codon:yes gene_type:complete